MVRYYYDKYNTVAKEVWLDTAPWESSGTVSLPFVDLSKNYSFSADTGLYTTSDITGDTWKPGSMVDPGNVAYVDERARGLLARYTATRRQAATYNDERTRHVKQLDKNTKSTTYSRGTLVQSDVQAENGSYPDNGRHTDGFWYVKKGVANTAPTTPTILNITGTLEVGKSLTIGLGGATDAENAVQYALEVAKNGGSFALISTSTTTSRSYVIPAGTTSLQFRVRAYDGSFYSPYKTGSVLSVNTVPTISVTTPGDAVTYYEGDIMAIAGSVTDVNSGNVVSVKYSIDGGTPQAITAVVSNGAPSSFAKNLTFKNGAFYDGTTAVTGILAEGSQHNVEIWAEDDKGGVSSKVSRSFYVVANRAASLTLDAFITRTGLINTDVVNVSGNVSDLDNGNVIVKYKIGNGAYVQVYNGQATSTPTPFNFNITLIDLVDGNNAITVQAVDAFNAVTQVVLNIKKEAVETPLLNAVTYYEITPPNGTADGLQLYVEREKGDLIVSADVFMGANGATEVFKPMTLSSTANLTNGNAEDTFSYQHTAGAAKIVVRINMTRSNATTNKAIKKISGVLT